ncbi:uncharacterized protein LOC143828304 [Paroedura picta]|uniref:uncharacterized protein LOC143828304 n=1 Tax=Paroedura picta TaxID=143630 RepID=UPI004056E8CF
MRPRWTTMSFGHTSAQCTRQGHALAAQAPMHAARCNLLHLRQEFRDAICCICDKKRHIARVCCSQQASTTHPTARENAYRQPRTHEDPSEQPGAARDGQLPAAPDPPGNLGSIPPLDKQTGRTDGQDNQGCVVQTHTGRMAGAPHTVHGLAAYHGILGDREEPGRTADGQEAPNPPGSTTPQRDPDKEPRESRRTASLHQTIQSMSGTTVMGPTRFRPPSRTQQDQCPTGSRAWRAGPSGDTWTRCASATTLCNRTELPIPCSARHNNPAAREPRPEAVVAAVPGSLAVQAG